MMSDKRNAKFSYLFWHIIIQIISEEREAVVLLYTQSKSASMEKWKSVVNGVMKTRSNDTLDVKLIFISVLVFAVQERIALGN